MFNKNFYPKNRFLKDEFTNGFVLKKFGLIDYFKSFLTKISIIDKAVFNSDNDSIKLSSENLQNNSIIYVSNNKLEEKSKKELINIFI